jgi:hypothetical protein
MKDPERNTGRRSDGLDLEPAHPSGTKPEVPGVIDVERGPVDRGLIATAGPLRIQEVELFTAFATAVASTECG